MLFYQSIYYFLPSSRLKAKGEEEGKEGLQKHPLRVQLHPKAKKFAEGGSGMRKRNGASAARMPRAVPDMIMIR